MKSGIATFYLLPFGQFRLDDGGLRLVKPISANATTQGKLDEVLAFAFDRITNSHGSTREALSKLPAAMGLPAASLVDIVITDEEPGEALVEGDIS